jgi:hypothetical protein
MKVSFPVESGNAAAQKDGFKSIQSILQKQQPEAVYFLAENGRRTGLMILNLEDASQIPEYAEPWFLAFNADIHLSPVMVPSDLQKAGPAIEAAVKSYA